MPVLLNKPCDARPSYSVGPWNSLPLITMRLLTPVGLALPRNPIGLPFLAGMASISTSSPRLNVSLLQPIALIDTGFCDSITQCTTLPASSLTSTYTKQCGFAQIKSVTVPFTITDFVASYDALP